MGTTTITEAVEIKTELEVDWEALGRAIAGEESWKQADFFLGFAEEVDNLQLAFIASERALNRSRENVADILEALAAHIRDAGMA